MIKIILFSLNDITLAEFECLKQEIESTFLSLIDEACMLFVVEYNISEIAITSTLKQG